MSALENLQEQLKNMGSKISQAIQDSPAFAQAKDRYENMDPPAQKMTFMLGVAVLLFLMFFIPFSYLSESQTSLSLFEERRNLIRELFKTHRDSTAAPDIVVPPSLEGLKSSVMSVIANAELLPEQNIGLSEGAIEGRLISSSLISSVLEVRLAKLNLKQIVDIGASIVSISSSVKMKDLFINANAQDTRYYDVTYKLYSLNVPTPNFESTQEPEPEKTSKKTRGSDE
ncbi:MAG: hypothetical protein AABY53_03030 [Bdellovibrionota bacterium]